MSTHIKPTAAASEVERGTAPLSLKDLVEALKGQRCPPSLRQLCTWLENARISADELQPYLGFKEGNYWRHRVFRSESVEMLVLCWRPGHRTPIHDHNGSQGAVLVHNGVLWETIFGFDELSGLFYKKANEYRAGAVTGADLPDIHQLGNPDISGQNLVTIHIYSPPLGVLNTYQVGSPKRDLYTPDDSEG